MAKHLFDHYGDVGEKEILEFLKEYPGTSGIGVAKSLKISKPKANMILNDLEIENRVYHKDINPHRSRGIRIWFLPEWLPQTTPAFRMPEMPRPSLLPKQRPNGHKAHLR